MGLPSPEQARTWGGRLLVDRDGDPIGTVTQIYTDDATGLPEWATIRIGEATVFLPLLDAREADGRIRVRVKRDEVAKAPLVVDRQRISEREEARLYAYYGIPYTPERSPSGLPAGTGPVHHPGLVERIADSRVAVWALAAAMTVAAALVAAFGARSRRRRP
jgi:hypothetical protein